MGVVGNLGPEITNHHDIIVNIFFCLGVCFFLYVSMQYSCNNITTTLIQISRLFYFGFFSKTNHQMII